VTDIIVECTTGFSLLRRTRSAKVDLCLRLLGSVGPAEGNKGHHSCKNSDAQKHSSKTMHRLSQVWGRFQKGTLHGLQVRTLHNDRICGYFCCCLGWLSCCRKCTRPSACCSAWWVCRCFLRQWCGCEGCPNSGGVATGCVMS